jgi:hypothetical protein
MHCGSRYGRRLHFAARGQHLLDRAESLAAKLASDGVGAIYIGVHHAQQADCFPLVFQFLVDSCVIAPKNAHAHDGDRDRILNWQQKFSMAGCRKQIVNVIRPKSIWTNQLRKDCLNL